MNGIRHKCPECPKDFSQQFDLKRHQRATHEGIRHQCPDCPKSFPYRGDLSRHCSAKHEKMLYPCEFCGKEFKRRDNFNAHAEICRGKENLPVAPKPATDWVILPSVRETDEDGANQLYSDADDADGLNEWRITDEKDDFAKSMTMSATTGENILERRRGNRSNAHQNVDRAHGKEKLRAASEPAKNWVLLNADRKTAGGNANQLESDAAEDDDFDRLRTATIGDMNCNDIHNIGGIKQANAICENGSHQAKQKTEKVSPGMPLKFVKFCAECGTKFIFDMAKFCTDCGAQRQTVN